MLGDWGKLIVAKGFEKLPKVQKIARSGHTEFTSVCIMFLKKIKIFSQKNVPRWSLESMPKKKSSIGVTPTRKKSLTFT